MTSIPFSNTDSTSGGAIHDEASLISTGLVLRALTGRPEFKGIVGGLYGTTAHIEDGDLSLWIHDLETAHRWRIQLERAEAQMALANEHQARDAAGDKSAPDSRAAQN